MIRSIELYNFMSHGRTLIEPADGLTVLTGPNNCGKSAVVSALAILCENATGDYMVRHGEKECRIVVKTDDGHVIEWKRLGETVSYTLDGVDVHRLGGKPPDCLHDLLRLGPVRAREGQQTYDIHFGQQKSPIFLLHEAGSRAATFFASASDADKLMAMQARHRAKVQDAQRDEKRVTQEAKRLVSQLKSLLPIGDIELHVTHAETVHAELLTLAAAMKVLKEAVAALNQQQLAVTGLSGRCAVLQKLSSPPRLVDTTSLEHHICATSACMAAEALARDTVSVLAKAEQPPAMADTLPLARLIEQTHEASRQRAKSLADATALNVLTDPPRLADVQPLTELVCQITDISAYVEVCREEADCLRRLMTPPPLADTLTLQQHIEQMQLAKRQVATVRRKRDALASLPQVPEMADETALTQIIDVLADAESHHAGGRARCRVLTRLQEPPQPGDIAPLDSLIVDLEKAEKAVSEGHKELTAAKTACSNAETALREWASGNRICPTCGGEIDPERLLASAASGLGAHDHG